MSYFFQSIIPFPNCSNQSYFAKLSEYPQDDVDFKCCDRNGCNWNPKTAKENSDYNKILVSFQVKNKGDIFASLSRSYIVM